MKPRVLVPDMICLCCIDPLGIMYMKRSWISVSFIHLWCEIIRKFTQSVLKSNHCRMACILKSLGRWIGLHDSIGWSIILEVKFYEFHGSCGCHCTICVYIAEVFPSLSPLHMTCIHDNRCPCPYCWSMFQWWRGWMVDYHDTVTLCTADMRIWSK